MAREAYREGFSRLRSHLQMYPASGRQPSVVFESAARTARTLAASCLPLGIAVAMHLYPLCVLQCMPVPRLSFARFQRAMLLRTIRKRSLILANAGAERTRGAGHALVARRTRTAFGSTERSNTCPGHVADVVLFKAPLATGSATVLCAADRWATPCTSALGDSPQHAASEPLREIRRAPGPPAVCAPGGRRGAALHLDYQGVGFICSWPTCIWLAWNACIGLGLRVRPSRS